MELPLIPPPRLAYPASNLVDPRAQRIGALTRVYRKPYYLSPSQMQVERWETRDSLSVGDVNETHDESH